MVSGLSLFAGISMGCSVSHGFGGSSHQLTIELSEDKEHFSENESSFYFIENNNKINITIHTTADICDLVTVVYNDKKYIFNVHQNDDQLVATCNILKGIEFIFSNCGTGRILSTIIDSVGNCFISADIVYGNKQNRIKFESIGMEVSNITHNTLSVSKLARKQAILALFAYAYDSNLVTDNTDFIFDDIKIIKDRYNALIMFSNQGNQKVIYLRGSLDHSIDIMCGGSLLNNKRYNLLLPDKYIDDQTSFSLTGYSDNVVTNAYDMIIGDGVLDIYADNKRKTFKYFLGPNKFMVS